jgi:hypothetical protein
MKIDKKTTTKYIITVIFVLVGTVFIVPIKANAETWGYVFPSHAVLPGGYSNIRGHLDAGKFVPGWSPRIVYLPNSQWIVWRTEGKFPSYNERGYVQADVNGGPTTATFYFNNPAIGKNTCDAKALLLGKPDPSLVGKCSITQRTVAFAHYMICFPHEQFCNPGGANNPGHSSEAGEGGASANRGNANSGDEDDNSGDEDDNSGDTP